MFTFSRGTKSDFEEEGGCMKTCKMKKNTDWVKMNVNNDQNSQNIEIYLYVYSLSVYL